MRAGSWARRWPRPSTPEPTAPPTGGPTIGAVNGELAHALRLALHGSAWLADPSGPPPTLDDGPTARYLQPVGFTLEGGPVADGPAPWLGWLHDRGVLRIGLVAPTSEARQVGGQPVEDHLLVAFAGAGRWALTTVDAGGGGTLAWPARWSVGDREAADQRIWDVTYEGRSVGAVRPLDRPLLAAAADLRTALEEIEAFARGRDDAWWGDAFAEARARFTEAEPAFPYYPDVIPDGLGLPRRRLAAVAAGSWVFGGMGSWNDQGFPDPEVRAEFDRVTGRLYRAVLDAFVAVVEAG